MVENLIIFILSEADKLRLLIWSYFSVYSQIGKKSKKVFDTVHGTLSKVQKIFRGKAASFAKAKMEEADHWLKKDKYNNALISANLAVVRAPSKGQCQSPVEASILPMSLFIRSEILFKKTEFKLSLNDLQLALKYHLSDDCKGAAYFRMGLCYLKLGDKNKAKVSLTVASACGNEEINVECQKILLYIESFLEGSPKRNKNNCIPVISERTDGLIGIRNSLTLCNDKYVGRYFKTSESISTGEVVASEDPYVSALLFDKHGSHCLHCYQRLKSPIPCPNCSGVAFCSIECLNGGLIYHKWECPYLELEIGSGMSILSVLSLRIITQQSLDYFISNKNKPVLYDQVLNLLGHGDQRDAKDYLHRTLMALFLLQILRHSGYFNGKFNERSNGSDSTVPEGEKIVLNEEEVKIGTLLLKHLQILQYNAHEIYETVIPEDDVNTQGVTNYIGLGLYLSSSKFNHECQPMLARYFLGKKLILRAQRHIKADQLVSENYGPVFTMKNRHQRQRILKGRYLFDCNCIACDKDWPMLQDMVPETAYFRCKNKNCSGLLLETGLCSACSDKTSLEENKVLFYSYQEDWESAVHLMTAGKFREAESIIIKYVERMCKLVSQPSKNLCLAMEALRTIWANTSGNVSILPLKNKEINSK